MSNNKDFKVKNGIQPTVYQEGVGTVVSAVEAYSLAAASYDSVSFSVASQDGTPYSLRFNNSGTKMFVFGATESVYQYSLSTAFDISTASYDSVSFSVTSQDANPIDIVFNTDGTKMYMVGYQTDKVHQYSLSTAFDISTLSYDSVNFSVGTQDANPRAITFNGDGSKLYMAGVSSDAIYQYSLSTAYDLSTASYDSVSLSVATEDTNVFSVTFNGEGSTFYILGTSDAVHQYSLSTEYDLSTASYDSVSFSISSQDTAPYGMAFNNDGTKLYISGGTGDSIYQYSTVLTTNTLDLSSGSVFEITPTSNIEVQLSNPAASGTSSGATLLLDGAETTGVASTFSTTLYTGTATARTITNGLDLAGDGGMTWLKARSTTGHNHLADTERGGNKWLYSNLTQGQDTVAYIPSFNSDGFDLNTSAAINASGTTYVSWTFKKQTKFFDVVTYAGDGVSGRQIAHNLGSAPGIIMIKRTNATDDWAVFHKDAGGILELNNTGAAGSGAGIYTNAAEQTSTVFRVFNNTTTNASGSTYVAYLFADNTAPDSLIKCGTFTTDAGGNFSVNLGWEPQWVMVKSTNFTDSWMLMDVKRGMSQTATNVLRPNTNAAESAYGQGYCTATATGFTATTAGLFTGSKNFIYMAIRAESVPTITYNTTLKWPSGTAPTSPAIGETDVITFNTTDGGTTYKSALAIDGAK